MDDLPAALRKATGLDLDLKKRAADEIERLRLTDEEREAIELAAGDYLYHQDPGGRAKWIRDTLRGLLERQ